MCFSFFLMVFILAFVMDDKGQRFGLLRGAIYFFRVQNGSGPQGFLTLLYIKKLLPPFAQKCHLLLSLYVHGAVRCRQKKSQGGCAFLLFEQGSLDYQQRVLFYYEEGSLQTNRKYMVSFWGEGNSPELLQDGFFC